MAIQQKPDDDKLRELILYIADLSGQDVHFGAIKLNKLLFYADFLAYQRLGRPITGQEYQTLPQGPAPRRLKPVIEKMQGKGDLRIERKRRFNRTQLRPIPGRLADLSKFNKEEAELVREMIARFWNMNATQISEESHLFLGWQLMAVGETIPYSTVLIGNRRPTEREKRRAVRLQKFAKEALAGNHR
ncbi:MAG: Panacea domain-containing protein [Candidatus Binataceae bacterium]